MQRGVVLRAGVRGIVGLVCSVVALLAVLPAHAESLIPGYPEAVEAYDPREVRLLPRYCTYTQSFRNKLPGGNDEEEVKRWYAYLGETFHALHHYCWGQMKTNRALFLAPNSQVRQFYLQTSILEFDYVIDHANDDFILLPEILTKRAENLIRLGRGPEALLNLDKAIRLKPDYWPPYATLGDYYKEEGDLVKAREWLDKGLQKVPGTTALTRRIAELGTRGEPKKNNARP